MATVYINGGMGGCGKTFVGKKIIKILKQKMLSLHVHAQLVYHAHFMRTVPPKHYMHLLASDSVEERRNIC